MSPLKLYTKQVINPMLTSTNFHFQLLIRKTKNASQNYISPSGFLYIDKQKSLWGTSHYFLDNIIFIMSFSLMESFFYRAIKVEFSRK